MHALGRGDRPKNYLRRTIYRQYHVILLDGTTGGTSKTC